MVNIRHLLEHQRPPETSDQQRDKRYQSKNKQPKRQAAKGGASMGGNG